jgi:hypothetical protein
VDLHFYMKCDNLYLKGGIIMKNAVFCLVLLLGFFMLAATCGSTPPPAPEPAPAPAAEAPPPPPPLPPPERAHDLVLEGAEIYVVEHRDTLSHIAKIKYGSGNGYYYALILQASRDLVANQDVIEPGMILTIPNLQANLNDSRARASMKNFFLEVAEITEREHKRPQDAVGLRKLAESL